jgi:hypothetical protein
MDWTTFPDPATITIGSNAHKVLLMVVAECEETLCNVVLGPIITSAAERMLERAEEALAIVNANAAKRDPIAKWALNHRATDAVKWN